VLFKQQLFVHIKLACKVKCRLGTSSSFVCERYWAQDIVRIECKTVSEGTREGLPGIRAPAGRDNLAARIRDGWFDSMDDIGQRVPRLSADLPFESA
jgi:hypothetical protein